MKKSELQQRVNELEEIISNIEDIVESYDTGNKKYCNLTQDELARLELLSELDEVLDR